MVKKEYTNKRPLKYSNWHRTLSDKCYAMNLDWIEIRNWKIVAIIEEKDARSKSELRNFTKKIMLDISNALNVPCYAVFHNLESEENKNLWQFRLIDLKTNKEQFMNEGEYRKFIEKL